MKAKLSGEEKEILESFEKGEWVPVSDFPKRKKELIEYARNTLRKDKRLNILFPKGTSLSCRDRQ